VGRSLRFTGLIAALAVCAALCAPAGASAAGFSWGQPGNFKSAGEYGVQSWSYSASAAALASSSSFAGVGGTYTGWVDSPSAPTTWIGVRASGTPSTVQMVPAANESVLLTWTSPFATSQQVTLSGTVTEPSFTGGLVTQCDGTDWTLKNGNTTVASGSGASGTISPGGPVTVSAAGTLVLTVSDAADVLTTHSASCLDTEVSLSITASAPASAITLTSPTSNQTLTSGQPTFAGAAGDGFGYDSGVTARLYSGSAATGTPVQTLTTTEQAGSWSIPSGGLVNGTYTVQAEQDDVLGDAYLSSPVTFTIANPNAPTVTLNSLGSSPVSTSTPTLTGTASTASGASQVAILISLASDPSHYVGYVTAPVGSNGSFSAQVTPALADGQYDAVAYQASANGGLGKSATIVFSIKVHAPLLTLVSPAAGSSVAQSDTTFSGVAGTVYGDASTVLVSLWHGTSAKGKPIGTARATIKGTTWSVTWPRKLALGLYTVQATQTDDAGHTTRASAHTFLAVPSSTTIGDEVTLTRGGTAYIPVLCMAPAGSFCNGTVLVVTSKSYQPSRGAPTGQLRVLFAYLIKIPGGDTAIARRPVYGAAKRLLQRKAPLAVHVTVTLSSGSGNPQTSTGTRTLRIGS
jgi:hypothetical protein